MTITQKFAANGYTITVEAIAIYEYVRLAFAFDPNVVWINNIPCLSLKQASAVKYVPALKKINGIKWSSSITQLTRLGFLEKFVKDEQVFYKIGQEARVFEGFSEYVLIPKEAIEAKPKVDPEVSRKEKIEKFKAEAIAEATRLTKEAFAKMPKNVKRLRYTQTLVEQFVEYWTAPLQNNPKKMRYEIEQTFVMPARLTTAWTMFYSKQAGDAPIDKL